MFGFNQDIDFNVGAPTKDNIEYAFKNLLFYLNSSLYLKIYEERTIKIEVIIDKVNKILEIYVNDETLKNIDEFYLQDIKYDLIDLDDETKILNSYYIEWSLMWFEALMSLRISEINLEEDE